MLFCASAASAEEKNAYFGDLHVHTRYSYDAFFFGTFASPDDAYRFAKGDPLMHPAGIELQLDRPLDFYAVTDHAYFLGMWWAIRTNPDHPLRSDPEAVRIAEAGDRYERGVAYRVAFRWPKEQYPAGGHALDVARHPGRRRAALRPGEVHDVHRLRVHARAEHGRAAPQRDLSRHEGAARR